MRNKRAKILRKRVDMIWDDDEGQLTNLFGDKRRFYKLCKRMWKSDKLIISRIGEKNGKKLYLFHKRLAA